MELSCEKKDVQEARSKIMEFERLLFDDPESDISVEKTCPVTHTFTDGMYMREIYMPAGIFIVSKIHKKKHPYFVMTGKAEIITDNDVVIVEAPYWGVTEPGTKRILRIIDDMVWVTCHATKETDLKLIEKETIAKDFKEIDSLLDSKIKNNLVENKEGL